jgi:hypothetical protein
MASNARAFSASIENYIMFENVAYTMTQQMCDGPFQRI